MKIEWFPANTAPMNGVRILAIERIGHMDVPPDYIVEIVRYFIPGNSYSGHWLSDRGDHVDIIKWSPLPEIGEDAINA
jgi:hypothetical protein